MKKSKKPFDAVKMMQEIRDKLSLQFQEMSFEEQQQYMRERLRGKAKPRRAGSRTQTTERIKNSCGAKPPHNAGVHKPVESRRSFSVECQHGGSRGSAASDAAAMGRGGEALGANRPMLGVPKGAWAVLFLDQDAAQTRLQGIRQRDALDVGAFAAPAAQSTPSATCRGQAGGGTTRGAATCRGVAARVRAWGRASRSRAVGNRAHAVVGVGCDAHPRTAAWRFAGRHGGQGPTGRPTGLCQRGQAGRVAATGGCLPRQGPCSPGWPRSGRRGLGR